MYEDFVVIVQPLTTAVLVLLIALPLIIAFWLLASVRSIQPSPPNKSALAVVNPEDPAIYKAKSVADLAA